MRLGQLRPKHLSNHSSPLTPAGGTQRRLLLSSFTACVLGASLLVLVNGAQAQQEGTEGADLHCLASISWDFSPGLTPEPSEQQIIGTMHGGNGLSQTTPCTSATGVPYKGMVATYRGTGELGCSAGKVAGTTDILWDDHDTSTAEWTAVSYGSLLVVEYTIVGGALEGTRVYQQGTVTGVTGNCVANSLTSAGYSGAATFFREQAEMPYPEDGDSPFPKDGDLPPPLR